MIYTALQTRGIFACHCVIDNGLLVAGIFVCKEYRGGDVVELHDRNDAAVAIRVKIPNIQHGYNVQMEVLDGV